MKLSRNINIDEALECYKVMYAQHKEDAAFGGEHHDGGYSHAIDLIKAFRAGMLFKTNGTLPGFLEMFVRQADIEADPDWSEYQRLKEKFEE